MTADEKVARLTTALQELEGFVRRNETRAQKAVEAAKEAKGEHPWRESVEEKLIEAEARLHEANRIKLVVVDRVREALS